jgi:hypothetical protein
MNKNKISSYFIFISFFTFLTVFLSIIQKSYFSFTTPQKAVEEDVLLDNFNPTLDLTIISTIESKNKNIDESFDFSIIKSSQSVAPTPAMDTLTATSSSEEATP